MNRISLIVRIVIGFSAVFPAVSAVAERVTLGPRPYYLVDQMTPGALQDRLLSCAAMPFEPSDWSIGHRGAALQFPEHTRESMLAAGRMGAGILECDVTFTKDRQLVCRHAQNDLHATTDILETDLAATCIKPFSAADGDNEASAECRTSDITLAEFLTLRGKMDAVNPAAGTPAEFIDGTASWRTDLYAGDGELLTHADYIALVKKLGRKFTPELKSPSVQMPFDGDYTQANFAQQMIDEYVAAGVSPEDVFAQSFNLEDVLYWIEKTPAFGKQAVYLDNGYRGQNWSAMDPSTWEHSMAELKAKGVNYIAPPVWVLVTLEGEKIVPSVYATEAKKAGLKLISWTVERSGLLTDGGGWYYQSIAGVVDSEGDVFELLNVLHEEVGVVGVFSDWPATTTYYANCFGL